MYPQTTVGGLSVNFDESQPLDGGNTYIMRSRLVISGAKGPWSAIQLPQYSVDTWGSNAPWSGSLLYNQKASLDIGTRSTIWTGTETRTYVSAVNINLVENSKYAVTGVNVWFRWMENAMFETTPSGDIPTAYQQKTGTAYPATPEWALIGSYSASSFTTSIPRSSSLADKYFQILITDNTTIKPDRFNYRWVGNLNVSPLEKIGESVSTSGYQPGYLPWNPEYSAATTGNPWSRYMRQRSTLQDIALFVPQRWWRTV